MYTNLNIYINTIITQITTLIRDRVLKDKKNLLMREMLLIYSFKSLKSPKNQEKPFKFRKWRSCWYLKKKRPLGDIGIYLRRLKCPVKPQLTST